uniref:DUF4283 domain-containing protein n=1 Tax=Noccaea caerulescens TaxID=107243 RepID=A0A1J3IEX4_NOCCA
MTDAATSPPKSSHLRVETFRSEVTAADVVNTVAESTTVTVTTTEVVMTEADASQTGKVVEKTSSGITAPVDYTIVAPKSTSPLLTNKASNSAAPSTVVHSVAAEQPPPTISGPPAGKVPGSSTSPPQTLADKIKKFEDKSLRRLAPITFADSGRLRVLIPDEVFKQGAELHRDFIVCYFNGRPPPYSQIQSVLSHMWRKGQRVEIHNNPLTRSMIVRIPNDYLRQKILEKGIWYVGDSMFHTAQWSSTHSSDNLASRPFQIWAHLTGVPLDLRHQRGLSLVAGLVGEPKETDDFTKKTL